MDGLSLPPPLPAFMQDATQQPVSEEPPAPTGPPSCKNCGCVLGEVLRCSVCKRATYCSPKCAKADWPYHKRTCEKPKAKEPPAPPVDKPVVPAPASSSPRAAVGATDEVELDDEERAAVEEVAKKGYRVHWRSKEDQAQWKEAVGDIRHDRVEGGGGAPTGGAVAAAGGPASAPPPGPASSSTASAWNTAGSLEQRTLGPWVRDRLKAVLREGRKTGSLVHPVPGHGRLVVAGVTGWGDSSADILIKGGKVKHVYDLGFKVGAELVGGDDDGGGGGGGGGRADDDVEMTDEGAAGGGGGGGGGSAAKSTEGKEKDKAPRVYLRFPDVSSLSEEDAAPGGRGREVVVEFSDAFPASAKDATRAALMLGNTSAGFTAEVRRVVEQVVGEFKAR